MLMSTIMVKISILFQFALWHIVEVKSNSFTNNLDLSRFTNKYLSFIFFENFRFCVIFFVCVVFYIEILLTT